VSGPGGVSQASESSPATASPVTASPAPASSDSAASPTSTASSAPEAPSASAVPAAPSASAAAPAGPAPRPRGRLRGLRRRWLVLLIVLVVLGLAGGIAWALLGSRLFVVRSVIVTGTHLVPKSEVLAVAGVKPGTPLVRVDTAQVAARVDTIRQVQSVVVTKSWPDRVVIAVTERTPALAVAAPGGGFDLVDVDGVVVQWAARRPRALPLYLATVAVTSLRGNPDVGASAGVVAELPAWLRSRVQSVTALSPDQVTLRLGGGVTVLWGGTDRAAAKAEELALLMRTHARYFDVSAPGTAVTN
jgi:cell division protein FtsQ